MIHFKWMNKLIRWIFEDLLIEELLRGVCEACATIYCLNNLCWCMYSLSIPSDCKNEDPLERKNKENNARSRAVWSVSSGTNYWDAAGSRLSTCWSSLFTLTLELSDDFYPKVFSIRNFYSINAASNARVVVRAQTYDFYFQHWNLMSLHQLWCIRQAINIISIVHVVPLSCLNKK